MVGGINLRLVLYGVVALALAISWGASCMIWRAAQMGDRIAPLDPREFAQLEVVAVGTGSAWENPERLGPSVAVGSGTQLRLVDAGRGIAEALRHAGIPVSQPQGVLLTALLPENTAGLDDLLLTGWLQGRSEPLALLGPRGTIALAEGIGLAHAGSIESLGRALALDPRGARFAPREVGTGPADALPGVRIGATAIDGGPLPALAWRFQPVQRERPRIVVTGTGWSRDALVEAARGADVWVHEAAYIPTAEEAEAAGIEIDVERLDRERLLRTPLQEVGGLAARAGVRLLALLRLRPPPYYDLQFTMIIGRDFDGRIVLPEDGEPIYP